MEFNFTNKKPVSLSDFSERIVEKSYRKQKVVIGVILLLLVFTIRTARAQDETPQTREDSILFVADSPILECMDSLYVSCYHEWDPTLYEVEFPDSIPQFSNDVYAERLALLNGQTPFPLEYNEVVQAYINLYATKRRRLTEKMLGLSPLYFPLFEQELDKQGLPLELKYLAIVESALNPLARSRSGAVGLWQFMYPTGKMYGLDVTSYVDERKDPILATQAAAEYLGFLYGMYNEWGLALAAYNAGPGNVNKAIRRSGGKMTYWEVRPYLPKETQGYVPAFIAVNYIMNYAKEHQIEASEPIAKFFETDTVMVCGGYTLLSISEVLDLSIEEIEFLNPVYKQGVVPYSTLSTYSLRLPSTSIGDFMMNEERIKLLEEAKKTEIAGKDYVSKEEKLTHRVRKGENLGVIARKYKCSVKDIKKWNNLSSDRLAINQRLTIYVVTRTPVKESSTQSNKSTESSSTKAKGSKHYTIKRGDTLWDIANRHDGVTVSQIKRLNPHLNEHDLKVGQKIKLR